jgi:endonuclease/exonuclease/phosphatase (EEP) superfamily protein YafD
VESVLDFIRNENPDFFLVLEVDTRWQVALEDLQNDFTNSVIRARSDNFGIALYSRHAITSHRVVQLDDSKVPTIVTTIDLNGQNVCVVGTHPLPPIGRRRSELCDRHLKAIGELIGQLPTPVMVLGDLNTTSWSPHFRDLLKRSGLRDSRRGFGVQPTWPDEPWFLRIPIDHALVSEDLVVTQRYVGPDIGSDHLPIVVEFAVPDSR